MGPKRSELYVRRSGSIETKTCKHPKTTQQIGTQIKTNLKASEPSEVYANASEEHPNVPERIRTGPHRSQQVPQLDLQQLAKI